MFGNGDSTADHSNKIVLTPAQHLQYADFLAEIKRIALSSRKGK